MCLVPLKSPPHAHRAITHKQSQLVSSCDNWKRVVEDAENELFSIKAFYAQRNAKKEMLAVNAMERSEKQHEIEQIEKQQAECEEEIAQLKQKIKEEREYIQSEFEARGSDRDHGDVRFFGGRSADFLHVG